LHSYKQAATNIGTCCEGQAVRAWGSLPEYLYPPLLPSLPLLLSSPLPPPPLTHPLIVNRFDVITVFLFRGWYLRRYLHILYIYINNFLNQITFTHKDIYAPSKISGSFNNVAISMTMDTQFPYQKKQKTKNKKRGREGEREGGREGDRKNKYNFCDCCNICRKCYINNFASLTSGLRGGPPHPLVDQCYCSCLCERQSNRHCLSWYSLRTLSKINCSRSTICKY
jgi:hypothetical protein